MTDLADFTGLEARDHGLAVVSTLRPDATISSSVVNAGVLPHPATGAQAVGFVSRGDARRLDYLRATPRVTVLLRAGWQWAAAEGPVQLCGPDDRCPAWTPRACACCCGRCSPQPGEPTRTGRPTTG